MEINTGYSPYLSQCSRSIVMMNNMEKFCLRWNDFDTNIREYFRELREEHSYFDVTLATDDHYQIEAHKVILAAGSKFFNDIFKKSNHKNILYI